MLLQSSLVLFSFLKNPHCFKFLPPSHPRFSNCITSIILSSWLMIHSSVSCDMLLIPSHVFFVLVVIFFSYNRFFFIMFKFSLSLCICLQSLMSIFITITLKYLVDSLPLFHLVFFFLLLGFYLFFSFVWNIFSLLIFPLCVHVLGRGQPHLLVLKNGLI